jgi:L-lactate utilization protein LutB
LYQLFYCRHDGDRVVVLSTFSIGLHDGDRVVVLSTCVISACADVCSMKLYQIKFVSYLRFKIKKKTIRAIENLIKLPHDRHHGSQ